MASCAFCSESLPDGPPWEPGPGHRLAYDPQKGRLWTVCPRCTRWNLTPLELRWETLEACEEAVRSRGRIRLATRHLDLVEVGTGELIRIGEATRAEFVDWRYGSRALSRASKPGFWARLLSRLPAPPLEGYDPYRGILASPAHPAWLASPFLDAASPLTYLFSQVPLAPRCPSCRRPLALHPWAFQSLRLFTVGGRVHVQAPCGLCEAEVGLPLNEARPALRLGMSIVLPPAFLRSVAGPGAGELEAAGGTMEFLARLAGSELALGEMSAGVRAGFLISLDELAEGQALEAEWREAEEIAAIADGELTLVPGFNAFRRRILENRE